MTLELTHADLREVTAYAVACAHPALALFEQERPDDHRPHEAIDTARTFAEGGPRTKAIRDRAWAAHRAAQETRDAGLPAASEAARAAGHTCGAAYLHPLAKDTQVKHILGAAACAARAFELVGEDAAAHLAKAQALTTPGLVDVLRRYPTAPAGGGRVGELIRLLDAQLRSQ